VAPALPLDPADVGDVLTPEQLTLLAQSFVILALYVEAEQSRCGTKPPDGE
jgi:hypothetical protein